MGILIGNAPCSWGVEFADDPRNPTWETVLDECAEAGYKGIELGPIGFMPEDPAILGPALESRGLSLIGGVVFQPFHDPDKWDKTLDAAIRTCKALKAHGAKHLVLIDSISEKRALTAGRPDAAVQMSDEEWRGFVDRIREIARIGTEEYGLTVAIHAHAAGFMDFEVELERLLADIDETLLKICLDTGHAVYAGFDPVPFMKKHMGRISYMHFKDIDPKIKLDTIENQTDFYTACGNGIFCNLGDGCVDFDQVRNLLLEKGFDGWCTVEQDCDPTIAVSPINDARYNRNFLESIGFA
ncbi:MAG: TIM barrel protein [Alphaproteobacteria bacterium]|nr:TIM barrel protein [Alphaproteobacteria bacterium]